MSFPDHQRRVLDHISGRQWGRRNHESLESSKSIGVIGKFIGQESCSCVVVSRPQSEGFEASRIVGHHGVTNCLYAPDAVLCTATRSYRHLGIIELPLRRPKRPSHPSQSLAQSRSRQRHRALTPDAASEVPALWKDLTSNTEYDSKMASHSFNS